MTAKSFVAMMRVKQWTKNLLIFLPLLLDNQFRNAELTSRSVLGFISFCLMASACYILNDIRDVEHDRMHAKKHKRQIASGNISVVTAAVSALILFVVSVSLSFLLGKLALLFLGVYFVLNYFYSGPIKKIKYLDILVLSSFYLLRLFYSWGVTHILLTGLFIATCTFLFLAASTHKRYMECVQSVHEKISGRGYSKADSKPLLFLTITFTIFTLAAFNVHAIFVLNIDDARWLLAINALATAILYFFFETRHNQYDDPVDRVLKKPHLLFLSVVFAVLYIFLVITRR